MSRRVQLVIMPEGGQMPCTTEGVCVSGPGGRGVVGAVGRWTGEKVNWAERDGAGDGEASVPGSAGARLHPHP